MSNIDIDIDVLPVVQPVELQLLYSDCVNNDYVIYDSNSAIVEVVYNDDDDDFESLPCLNLKIRNTADIPFENNGLSIKDIRIENNVFLIGETITYPISIHNGKDTDYEITINCDRNLIFEKIHHSSNKELQLPIVIEYSINDGSSQFFNALFSVRFREQIINQIFSLDYGTTGIVLSMYDDDIVDAVVLRDVEDDPLEKDETIVSSISILKNVKDKERTASLVLAPGRLEYDQGAEFILVPTKFLIGQPSIPFVDVYARLFDEIDNFSGKHIREIKAEDIIKHSYKDIFERFNHDGVKKLILTYPNTYVPEQIKILREILKEEFSLLDDSNIHFVPESDSVVSYYVDKRINKSSKGFPKNERVLIYDMGAGTLDISYVEITRKADSYVVELKKRIGIPIAGNYLDYELFQIIKDEISENSKPRAIKDFIKNYLKIDLSKSDDNNNMNNSSKKENYLNSHGMTLFKTESQMGKDEIIDKVKETTFFTVCSDTIFRVLFPNDAERWSDNIDTFVFSGRASQFTPLFEAIKSQLKKGTEIELLEKLKTCVSEGAIYYQQIKDDPENNKIAFKSRSQNLKLGVVFAVDNEDGGLSYDYRELINPDSEDWDSAEEINGTLYLQLSGEATLNLKRNNDVKFVQTLLSDDAIRNFYIDPLNKKLASQGSDSKEYSTYDIYDCFINTLFTIKPKAIKGNREKVQTKVVIDKNNNVSVSCNGYKLKPKYYVENVENNEYYKRAAWPSNSERL